MEDLCGRRIVPLHQFHVWVRLLHAIQNGHLSTANRRLRDRYAKLCSVFRHFRILVLGREFSVMSIFPLLYGVNVLIAGIVFVGFYQILKKYGPEPIKTYTPNEARLQREIKDTQMTEAFLEVRVTDNEGKEEFCNT